MNRLLVGLFMLSLLLGGCDREPVEPDTLPLLRIEDASVMEGNDGSTPITFRVALSTSAEADVVVTYNTIGSSATSGEDFIRVENGNIRIPAGATEAQIEILVIGDTEREVNETFNVQISEATNTERISRNQAIGTIENDDNDIEVNDIGYTTPTSYPGFDLVWEDEFDGNALNTNDWTYEFGTGDNGWGNNELQSYSDQNTTVSNGFLFIEARREGANNYSSSRIITRDKQSFQYGRVDIRALLPKGQGIWPALWMLGSNFSSVGWPRCGEIDIMELVGGGEGKDDVVHGTVHWEQGGQRALFGGDYQLPTGIFNDEFHVFSIIWTDNAIRWLMDDIEYHVIDTSPAELDEFRNSFFFIFNVAVGGDWPGSPDGSTEFPQMMVVDYVRVFQPN